MVREEAGGQVLFKSRYWMTVEACKPLLLSTFLQKLPRQRESLIALDDFGKIIDVAGEKYVV